MKKKIISYFSLLGKCKILLIMKLSTILMMVFALNLSAIGFSQFTFTAEGKKVREVFNIIEKESNYRFFYNDELESIDKVVNLKFEGQDINQVLDKLLESSDFAYKVFENNLIVISLKDNIRKQSNLQQLSIKGTITDEKGNPIAGVTVSMKGTTRGTTSDVNGNYFLEINNPQATLIFSFIGFKNQEIAVDNRSQINVIMVVEAIDLEEVVVIGYGTQSKAMISTAISSINAEKLISIPVTDPAQAMVGQIAGVRFQQASGEPGSAPYIRIRGNGSLTSSNSPLFVIDGYPTDDANLFNTILPNDIESIDVLKDAASAAIYGSRAGNGVILVTTKSGKLGKTKFTVDVTSGVQQVVNRYEMAGPELFVEVVKEARINQGMTIPDFLNQPERWVTTDWQDVIFRNAPYQNVQIGASGGSEKMNFNLSLGYLDNQGVIVNSFEKRYSLRASFNAMLTQKLKVGVNIAPTLSTNRGQSTSGGNTATDASGILADAVSNIPILPVWKDNGDYYIIVQDAEMKTIFNDQLSNPLNKLDANKDYTNAFRQTANVFVSFEPIKGLVLKSTLNTGVSNSRGEMYREAFLARGNGNTGNISTPNLAQITARRSNGTNLNWYWSNTAAYDFKINEKHVFTALLGYDASRQQNYSLTVTPRTDVDNPVAFINTSIKNVSGAILTTGTSSKDEYVLDAFFGRVNYSFDRKYLLSASIRRDRSSRFGPENRAGFFPSISAAWNITEESFMENIKYLSSAKIRISYGETGNDRLSGSYPWLSTLSKNYYNFGTTDARVLTYAPGGFSNSNLGWEKNKQFDAGLDVGFFNDRLSLNMDVYERNSNTIISASIPTINGKASSSMQNIGNVKNRGLEITFNSKNFTGTFKWQTDFNISFNRNRITALNGDAKVFGAANSYIRNYLDRPMADIYAYRIVGTFNNAQDLIDYPKFGTQGIGDLRYDDVSGPAGVPDGKIDANDMTLIGNAQPDFVFGITNSMKYKNFDLNILLDGSYGGYVVNQFDRAISLNRQLENTTKRAAENRWKSEEDPGDGKTPMAGSKYLSTNITTNDRYVFETSFIRIRNISLGYVLPKSVLQKIRVQSMRVFITVTNLHTFTNYPGWNPEGNTNGDNATSNGYDLGSYPVSRNSSIGISLGF
jgi:TonB-linked SusC/RagA family outer membrane protein